MTQEQLDVLDELALEISACDDPAEREELENTLCVCRELAYGVAEGIIECKEDENGELMFFSPQA